MTHVFLDLETLGRKATAVFFQLSAVAFDPRTFALGHKLDIPLSADDQVLKGRTIDEVSVQYHASKGRTVHMSYGLDMREGLRIFAEWLASVEPQFIWIWGSDFDHSKLEDAYESIGQELPWPYYRTQDARSFWNVAFPFTKRPARPHDALGDCYAGINDLRAALSKLGILDHDPAADELADFFKEGWDAFEIAAAAISTNPYMGLEGLAWLNGYTAAQKSLATSAVGGGEG